MASSPTARLAKYLLGEDLETWVSRYREIGLSWPKTARLLDRETGGEVQISAEQLRRMYSNSEAAA